MGAEGRLGQAGVQQAVIVSPACCRQYCTRRLRRIYKRVKFLHGRGRYQKKKLEPEGIKDVRCAGAA